MELKKDYFKGIEGDFIQQSGLATVVGRETFLREVSFALQIKQTNDLLNECKPESFLKAVLNVAQVGLTLNPVRKFAYLVPKRVNGEWQALLMPSYIGMCKLITDDGNVVSIQANLIYEGDEITMDIAQNTVNHIPYVLTGKPKGQLRGCYSIASLKDGSRLIELMSRDEIDLIRDRSDGFKAFKSGKAKSAIWETDYGEMARKTVIKRHYKYLPKSKASEKVERAIDMDNRINGFEELPSLGQLQYATGLLKYVPEQKVRMYEKMIDEAKSSSEISELIEEMQSMKPDVQTDATTYGQREIARHIKEKIETED